MMATQLVINSDALWAKVLDAFRAVRAVSGYDTYNVRRQVANARANTLLEVWCDLTGEDSEAVYEDVAYSLQREHDEYLSSF